MYRFSFFFLIFAIAVLPESCARFSTSPTLPDSGLFLLTSPDFSRRARQLEARTLSSVDELVEAGILLNPQLRSLAFRILAQRSLADQGPIFDTPMISLFTMGMVESWSVMVGQKLPWPSKLRRDLEVRRARVQAAAAELSVLRNVLFNAVKVKYFELCEMERNRERLERKLALQKKIRDIRRAVWASAGGGGTELVLLDVSIAQTENDLQNLDASRTRTIEAINALLGRRGGKITASGRLPWKLRLSRGILLSRAVARAPEIEKLRAELQVKAASEQSARLQYLPDFQVSVGWGGTADPSMGGRPGSGAAIMLGLTLRMPAWYFHVSRQLQSLQYEQESIRAGIDAVKLRISAELRGLLARYDALQDTRCRLAGLILPRTRKAVETLMLSWSAGADDLQKLLQMVDLQFQLEAQADNELTQMAAVVARMEELTGETVGQTAPEDESCQK